MSTTTDNAVIVEAWNTILFQKFCRFRYVLTDGLSGHSNELLRRRPYSAGARVLDVGCGFGDTARLIAEQVGPSGAVFGVDCAPNFVDAATREAADAGIEHARFFVADVQTESLRGPYDHAFSRFGTMFFNFPVAALRNIRSALRPGGTLTMIVWRKREDNPWVHEAELRVRDIVPVVSHEETDQVHCGPGPFSMASADLVSDMLRLAGYEHITLERYDAEICIGRTLEDAIEFAMALGPAGEIIRLAGEEGEKRKGRVIDALRGALADHAGADGVWMTSSSWFVTASNPLH
ncbi:MAG TPA: class I SAM-dependent methyltransferase [Xanthobacteraceae bacterium]|nr:class I SAM-dependent methyltransferase [Xanthobacteraceae bacterium]